VKRRWNARDRGFFCGRPEGYGNNLQGRKIQAKRSKPILNVPVGEEGGVNGVCDDGADEECIVWSDTREEGSAVGGLEAYGTCVECWSANRIE